MHINEWQTYGCMERGWPHSICHENCGTKHHNRAKETAAYHTFSTSITTRPVIESENRGLNSQAMSSQAKAFATSMQYDHHQALESTTWDRCRDKPQRDNPKNSRSRRQIIGDMIQASPIYIFPSSKIKWFSNTAQNAAHYFGTYACIPVFCKCDQLSCDIASVTVTSGALIIWNGRICWNT